MATVAKPKSSVGSLKLKPMASKKDRQNFRIDFGISRTVLVRLTGLSERTLATWENGGAVGEPARRALLGIERLLKELGKVIRKRAIPEWLDTPNPGFGNLKPIEVIERGKSDQIWRMIYFLGSGTAS